MTKTKTSAKNAKNAKNTKNVKNQQTAFDAFEYIDIPVAEPAADQQTAAALVPADQQTAAKVDAKTAAAAAGKLRAKIREDRRGANATIRLMFERAAALDADAINVLCALCDVPAVQVFTINKDSVRAAVNEYFPYYREEKTRRVNVRAAGIWYTTAAASVADQQTAAAAVLRGYVALDVIDYLDAIILAAKTRAKGIKPRRVDAEAVYKDIKLNETAADITAAELLEADKKQYTAAAANVWKKDRNGFYI